MGKSGARLKAISIRSEIIYRDFSALRTTKCPHRRSVIRGKEISKLDSNPNLSVTERSVKVRALHEDTYGKMKPLLSAVQLELFEKILKVSPKKK